MISCSHTSWLLTCPTSNITARRSVLKGIGVLLVTFATVIGSAPALKACIGTQSCDDYYGYCWATCDSYCYSSCQGVCGSFGNICDYDYDGCLTGSRCYIYSCY